MAKVLAKHDFDLQQEDGENIEDLWEVLMDTFESLTAADRADLQPRIWKVLLRTLANC